MMLVKAGAAVDALIDQVIPFLEEGDIIIDGGNSHYLIQSEEQNMLKRKACCMLVLEFQEVRKVRLQVLL